MPVCMLELLGMLDYYAEGVVIT